MKPIIILMVIALVASSTAYPRNVQRYSESFMQKDAYEPKNPSEEPQQILLNVESYVTPINDCSVVDPNLRWGIPLVPFVPYKGLNELTEMTGLKGMSHTGPAPYIPHEQHHFQGHHSVSQFQAPAQNHYQSYAQHGMDDAPFPPHTAQGGFHGQFQQQHFQHHQAPPARPPRYQAQYQAAQVQETSHERRVQETRPNSYSHKGTHMFEQQEKSEKSRPGRPDKISKMKEWNDDAEPKRVVEASKVKQVAKEVARVVKDGGDESDVEAAVSRFLI